MDTLITWLIYRLQSIYNILVVDLHIPTKVAFIIGGALVVLFFFDLYDIYTQRRKEVRALIWLAVVLLVPCGTIIYLGIGSQDLRKAPLPAPKPQPPLNPAHPNFQATEEVQPATAQIAEAQPVLPYEQRPYQPFNARKATTVIGTIVGVVAIVVGVAALVFFVLIVIALVQCANDPKCM